MKVLAIGRNAVRSSYFPVMAHKAYLRARHGTTRERRAATSWAARHAVDLDGWARSIDPGLWEGSVSFARDLRAAAEPRIEELAHEGIDLGGGGCCELLHFLARLRGPRTVLETGVAAGWSTTALLTALRENGGGHLYSSDFPYFRINDPERFVGYLVPEALKGAWTLHTAGDRRNLARILRPGMRIDLVHYDSDKSRQGREFFLRRVTPYLADGAVVVMDDINDNLAFREYVRTKPLFRVFEYHGKYVGLVGA